MCSAKEAVAGAAVGVFAYVARDGRPRALAVTPYVDGDHLLVTSTLALLAKVRALVADPRAAVLAGGQLVAGTATLEIDPTSHQFDAIVREQELAKYPPSRSLLKLPGHRRLLWWYVGRVFVRLPVARAVPTPGPDRVTVTYLEDGNLRIVPLAEVPVDRDEVALPVPVPDGPAVVLVHEEHHDFADLRQLVLHGDATNGVLHVHRRTGSLDPAPAGTVAQLRTLRHLARSARRDHALIDRLTRELAA